AYDLYLKGRYAWNQRGTKLLEAERLFKAAIARDSTFALAWSGLADTYIIMSSSGYLTQREAAIRAPRYAEKAVSLDSTLQEPRVSLGYAHCHLGKRYEARDETCPGPCVTVCEHGVGLRRKRGYYASSLGRTGTCHKKTRPPSNNEGVPGDSDT